MKKHSRLKIAVLSFLAVVILSVGAFLIWASDFYHAQDEALAVMRSDNGIKTEGNFIVLSPPDPSDTALVFYPGAKVEAIAYLPILEKIREKCGITCILVKMPLNMAIFDSNVADSVMERFPEIKNWYIGGHSMGGAMASDYASRHQNKVQGLILLGAYIYGNYPPEKSLTIYGTFNADLEKSIHYSENIVVINGGNHAQFGNYGKQNGDPDATITADEQQNIAVDAISDFIAKGHD